MPSTNGHTPLSVILYARVSTEEQARHGYSMRQQLERGRQWAAEEGREVIAEIEDPGQSGATLERPGMDWIRDRVAQGGVGVVWAQDRDRFAREPAYLYLLGREFEEYGTKLRAANDRGDDSPEGELTNGILDQLAKFERAKIVERSRRGRLRKAREGKLIRTSRPHYGFKYDPTGERYVVDEAEMRVVRRIFRAVAEGQTLHRVKRSLELEGVPPPTNGGRGGKYWIASYIRRVVKEDVYKPHPYAEVAELVAAEVAAKLDKGESHGIFWFNRTRTTRKRVSMVGTGGREYKWRNTVRENPRDQWVAIPVPDSGITRELVAAARAMLRDNRPPGKSGRRFWELPSGAVRCGACGKQMHQYSVAPDGRIYAYYRCSRLVRFGKDGCSPDRVRTTHRAEEVERRVWEFVSGLMKDPEQLRDDLERMIELEKRGVRGDPDVEAKAWLDKLAEVDDERRGFLRLAARGSISDAELDEALAELEETRSTAEHELASLQSRQEAIEALERDKEALLDYYASIAPEALDSLIPEERHQLYRMLRLEVVVRLDANLEVSGVFGAGVSLSDRELVPHQRA